MNSTLKDRAFKALDWNRESRYFLMRLEFTDHVRELVEDKVIPEYVINRTEAGRIKREDLLWIANELDWYELMQDLDFIPVNHRPTQKSRSGLRSAPIMYPEDVRNWARRVWVRMSKG